MTDPVDVEYLSKERILKTFSIKGPNLAYWIKNYDFPKPIYVTDGCPMWRNQEVKNWIESRKDRKWREGKQTDTEKDNIQTILELDKK